jgi:hypothetical protein
MLRLMLCLFFIPGVVACGSQMERKETTTTAPPQAGIYTDPAQNDCTKTGGCVPVYTGATPVYGATPAFTHYTMLDTPDANLCADAFIRTGIDLPPDIIARTLGVNTSNSNSLVTDSQVTTYPVMTIVRANSCNAAVTLQLLNPNGYYCFAGLNSCKSSVTIQKNCDSKSASLEPMGINNNASYSRGMHLWWWPKPVVTQPSDGAFFGSYNNSGSSIKEVPCLP